MKIKVCIPSYHRPKVETLDYLPHASVYVSNEELSDYQRENPGADIIGVDPQYQGNLCRIRNYILDHNPGNIVVILDDDLKYIWYYEDETVHHLNDENEVMRFLFKYSVIAIDLGVKLWGVNITTDKQAYREYTPFSLTSYIGGPFQAHIDSDIRYDESLPLKEDYDMTLQHCNKYRKVLRLNKFFLMVRQVEQSGGCSTYRTFEEEKKQLDLLRKKWGSKIVKYDDGVSRSHNTDKTRHIDINPIIRVPIRGI
jgi:hypothetical protein